MTFTDRYLALLTWIALFVVGLIWLCLPPGSQPWWPVVLGLILLTGLGAAVLPARGSWRANQRDVAIPATVRELPIILVAGPYAAVAFAHGAQASTLRRNGDAVWMLVRTPDELAQSIATIKDSHQRLPDAVLMPVIPDGEADDALIRREFSRWRHELDASAHHRAYVLPCYIAVYACLGMKNGIDNGTAARPFWFGDVIDIPAIRRGIENMRQPVSLIRSQLDRAWLAPAQPEFMTRAGLGHAVFDWLEDAALLPILSALANTAPLSLRGLLLADIGYSPVRAGAWTRWLTGKTGLQPLPIEPKAQPLPLPEIIACQAHLQVPAMKSERRKSRWRTLHAVAASAVTVAAAIGVSGWANSRLVARVADNLDAYRNTPLIEMDARRERLETLRNHYADLTRYASTGVPATLGWGLYRGEVLRAALKPLIAAEPVPPGVTIDNLSLFDSGKTTLKPGAEPRLKGALDLIRANPDKRILISGHTDNVGPSAANLQLSEARARAIRDWFVSTASLPVTRFAIQGYGDTRPVASNDTSSGREMNRRVEITLIPDSGAH